MIDKQKLIDELIRLDPSLADNKRRLDETISLIIESKPEVRVDKDFRENLKRELMLKAKEKSVKRRSVLYWFLDKKIRVALGLVCLAFLIGIPAIRFLRVAPYETFSVAVDRMEALPETEEQERYAIPEALKQAAPKIAGIPAEKPVDIVRYDKAMEIDAPPLPAPSVADMVMDTDTGAHLYFEERARSLSGIPQEEAVKMESKDLPRRSRISESAKPVSEPKLTVYPPKPIDSVFLDTLRFPVLNLPLSKGYTGWDDLMSAALEKPHVPRLIAVDEVINRFDYKQGERFGDSPFAVASEGAVCLWNPETKLIFLNITALEDLRGARAVVEFDRDTVSRYRLIGFIAPTHHRETAIGYNIKAGESFAFLIEIETTEDTDGIFNLSFRWDNKDYIATVNIRDFAFDTVSNDYKLAAAIAMVAMEIRNGEYRSKNLKLAIDTLKGMDKDYLPAEVDKLIGLIEW